MAAAKFFRWILCASVLAGTPSLAQESPLRVAASIKPVHSLVAGVMKGIADPVLLIPGSASPHEFALRPSKARSLNEAEVVFWIGPAMEAALARPLTVLAAAAEIVTLSDLPGVIRLARRAGGDWGDHHHDHDEEPGHDGDDHGHRTLDGHLWLDPRNAIAMTRVIASRLSAANPQHAERINDNATAQIARLQDMDKELTDLFARLPQRPYIVFHDAYQYFERRYGLRPAGAITLHPERPPGARRVREIQTRIQTSGAACVFAEPQFEPKLIDALIAGTSARKAELDPLGAGLPDGPSLYTDLLRGMAAALRACLAPAG